MNITINDKNNILSQDERALVQYQAENLNFDWVEQEDLEVYISKQESGNGLDIQVLVENNYGYFGWNTNHLIMANEIKVELCD